MFEKLTFSVDLLNVKLRSAIIEDEEFSRLMVENMAERTGLINLVGSFSSAQEATLWLNNNPVDLLFLDIEIPDFSGFDLLKSLNYRPEAIVITGNPAHAAVAYELSIADFLVKPLKDYSRFLAAVQKVMQRRKMTGVKNTKEESFFVKVDSLLVKLELDDILWIEALGDYVKIQTRDKNHTVYSTLKKFEERLDREKFVRVHRSFIINISKISNINPNNLQIDKRIIPISTTYREDLLSKISII